MHWLDGHSQSDKLQVQAWGQGWGAGRQRLKAGQGRAEGHGWEARQGGWDLAQGHGLCAHSIGLSCLSHSEAEQNKVLLIQNVHASPMW